MEENDNNYLILKYKNIPDTDFLCDYQGKIRIKILKMQDERKVLYGGALYALADNCVFLIEDIGSKIRNLTELKPAIHWYKQYCKFSKMCLVISSD